MVEAADLQVPQMLRNPCTTAQQHPKGSKDMVFSNVLVNSHPILDECRCYEAQIAAFSGGRACSSSSKSSLLGSMGCPASKAFVRAMPTNLSHALKRLSVQAPGGVFGSP